MPKVVSANRVVRSTTKKINQELDKTAKLESRDEFGKPLYIKCKNCNRIKAVDKFLTCQSGQNKTGYTYLCKDCCAMLSLNTEGFFDKQKVYDLLKVLDKPFINDLYEKVDTMLNSTKTRAIEEKSKISVYLNLVNSTKNGYRTAGFDHSEEIRVCLIEEPEEAENTDKNEDLDLWGNGWSKEERKQLNGMFEDYQNNYPLRTAMHKMALIKICKLQLRYDNAIAQNDTTAAKYWGDLLSKAQNEAKFNPNQLSAADLSDGMTCWSQVSQAVEREKDIIGVLKKYVEQPYDRVDYNIYMNFDYLFDAVNLPHVKYKDIWAYMFSQYERNSKEFGKDVVPKEDKPSPNAILVEGEE